LRVGLRATRMTKAERQNTPHQQHDLAGAGKLVQWQIAVVIELVQDERPLWTRKLS